MAEDIDIARLVVQIEARTKQFEGQLKKLEGKTTQGAARMSRGFKQLDSSIASAGKRFLLSFGTGLLAGFLSTRTIGTLKNIVSEVGNLGEEAQKAGVSIKELQQLRFAGISTGIDEETLSGALAKFNKFLGESLVRGGGLARFFEANGVALRDQNGQMRKTADLFVEIGDLVKNAANDQERQVILTGLLGRGGAQMTAFFMQGSEAIRGMMKEAEAAGAVIDKRIVDAADEFFDRWAQRIGAWTQRFKGAIAEIAINLANIFTAPEDRDLAALQVYQKGLEELVAAGEKTAGGDLFGGLTRNRAELERINAQIEKLLQAQRDAAKGDFGATRTTIVYKDFFNTGDEKKGPDADAFKTATAAIRERTRALIEDAAVFGVAAGAAARYRAEQELLRAAEAERKELTPELREEIERTAVAYGAAADELARLAKNQEASTEAAEKQKQAYEQAATTLASGLQAAIDEFASGSAKAKDIFSAFARSVISDLSSIASAMVRNNLIKLFTGAFGGGLTGGAGGGGAFGGALAHGGPVTPGRAYLVGERGPEFLVPRTPGTVVPNGTAIGGGAGATISISTTIDARGSDMSEARLRAILDQRDRNLQSQFGRSVVPAVRHAARQGRL